jgi:hypothetical protein
MTHDAGPSRHINLWLKPKSKAAPAIYDVLDEIQREVMQSEARRKRSEKEALRFRDCLRAICLDLFAANASDPDLEIGVHKGNSALSGNASYPEFVTARCFLAALAGLQSAGYAVELSCGTEGSGMTTRVMGTPKLMEKLHIAGEPQPETVSTRDTIRLKLLTGRGKHQRKVYRKFRDTSDTIKWRNNLAAINQHTGTYFVTLDCTTTEVVEMEAVRKRKAVLAGKQYRRIEPGSVTLHRVFNSPDFTEGGRFYGAWWQSIPKDFRRHIQINFKGTCEHDFASIHPLLLYAQLGISRPKGYDPYSAPHGLTHRKAVKKAFNVMLNSDKEP